MDEKGMTGSHEDLQALFSEHNIDVSDFTRKAQSVLRNPLYVGALKKAGAPIEDIKNIISALSGGGTARATPSPTKKRGSTRFKRL